MHKQKVNFAGRKIPVYSAAAVVAGSGAAGLNAAKRLYDFDYQDIIIVTEGMKKGTSRNTGSDKQTYYKLSLSGDNRDSVYDMARTYYEGGAMHGDLAKVEAALSVRSFFHLVEIGVPFPHTAQGEYVGYKTDHDPARRATSAGPLTSHYMTKNLEREVQSRKIPILDQHQLAGVLTYPNREQVLGLLAINLDKLNSGEEHLVLINCREIVYATGGPAQIYKTSVYPESQTGASGLAFEAGARGQNLTESQYGLASTKFRWNLSGTYQQVIPRYVSTAQDGSQEEEFLQDYFSSPGKMMDAIFLKGYQWPFDPRKIENQGSSLIDLLVYREIVEKNRRVWLDYRKNPAWASDKDGELKFELLSEEAYNYLKNSQVLGGTPITRLRKMNEPAYQLYKDNDIDLAREKLEIAVCAQHNNGGLLGDKWWQSNLKNFFPVGEANGSHGVYRPGGSALNSGQVGSLRAAEFIANKNPSEMRSVEKFIELATEQLKKKISFEDQIIHNNNGESPKKLLQERQQRMSETAAIIRDRSEVMEAEEETRRMLDNLPERVKITDCLELSTAYHLYDCLLTQLVYLNAIADYIDQGGQSRGSYLILRKEGKKPLGELSEFFKFKISRGEKEEEIQTVKLNRDLLNCKIEWMDRRPLKEEDLWFEKEWKKFREGEIYN